MIHSVYKTINIVNQNYYIGKHTSEDPNDDYLGSGVVLQKAIKKYGVDNFKKEILTLCETEQEAYDKEQELLEKIDGLKDPMCYNLCYGGVGFWKGATHSRDSRKKISDGNTGKVRSIEARQKYSDAREGTVMTEETKKKLSDLNTGKKLSEETKKKITENNGMRGNTHTSGAKEKISQAHKGRPSIRKGTTCTNETKEKMSESQRGRLVSEDHKQKISESTKGEKNHNFGTIWITNGEKNMKFNKVDSIPNGWYRGRVFNGGYKNVRD